MRSCVLMPISLLYNAKGASKLSAILHDQKKRASARRVDTESDGLRREKERFIEEPGIPWTFQRPPAFMSKTLQWVSTIRSQSRCSTRPLKARFLSRSCAESVMLQDRFRIADEGLSEPEKRRGRR